MPKKKKGETKRPASPLTSKVTMLMPDQVKLHLKKWAADEGCSMSWLVTALIMEEREIKPSMLKGHRPPKYFKDRVGDWTPNKKKKTEPQHQDPKEPETETKTTNTNTNTNKIEKRMAEFDCSSCGEPIKKWADHPDPGVQDSIKQHLCGDCYDYDKKKKGEQSSR